MNEFICIDCLSEFDVLPRVTEMMPDGRPYTHPGCPHCFGEVVESVRCSYCEHLIFGKYIRTANGERYCAECYTNEEI